MKKNRLAAILLTASMLCGMLPTAAFGLEDPASTVTADAEQENGTYEVGKDTTPTPTPEPTVEPTVEPTPEPVKAMQKAALRTAAAADGVSGEMTGAELLAKAENGVITLTGDVTLTSTFAPKSNSTVTLDLNGFTLAFMGDSFYDFMSPKYPINVSSTATLTIQDSSEAKTGKITDSATNSTDSSNHGLIYSSGTLNLMGGTIEAQKANGVFVKGGTTTLDGADLVCAKRIGINIYQNGTGTAEIKSGSITVSGTSGYGLQVGNKRSATMTGGTITVKGNSSCGVFMQGAGGSINLQGGTINDETKNKTAVGVQINGANNVIMDGVTINTNTGLHLNTPGATAVIRGTTAINASTAIFMNVSWCGNNASSLTVEAGTLKGKMDQQNETLSATVSVTGGTFSEDVGKYIPEDAGKAQAADGQVLPKEQVAVPMGSVAQVDGKGYTTLTAAFAAVAEAENKTVTLLADVDYTKENNDARVAVDVSGVTIDLNGHTVTTGYYTTDDGDEPLLVLLGDFTLKNGKVQAKGDYGIFTGNVASVNPDTVVAKIENVEVLNGGVNVGSKVELTNVTAVGNTYYAVWSEGNAIIKSGKYSSNGAAVLGVSKESSGSMTVEGGTFTAKGDSNPIVLKGYIAPLIKGGTFNRDMSQENATLDDTLNWKKNSDGTWTVEKKPEPPKPKNIQILSAAFEVINSYETLQQAIDAYSTVEGAYVISYSKPLTESVTIRNGQNVVISLDHNLSNEDGKDTVTVDAGGWLTIWENYENPDAVLASNGEGCTAINNAGTVNFQNNSLQVKGDFALKNRGGTVRLLGHFDGKIETEKPAADAEKIDIGNWRDIPVGAVVAGNGVMVTDPDENMIIMQPVDQWCNTLEEGWYMCAAPKASFNGAKYVNLQELIDNVAAAPVEITLEGDVEGVVIPEGKTITLNLNGKKVKGTSKTASLTNNGTLTILGSGTVQPYANDKNTKNTVVNNGSLTIKGGNFTYRGVDTAALFSNSGTIIVEGGTFSQDISAVATPGEGLQFTADGKGVEEKLDETNAAAKIVADDGTTTYYKTLQAAIEACPENGTVKVIAKNVSMTDRISIQKSLTIVGETADGAKPVITMTNSGRNQGFILDNQNGHTVTFKNLLMVAGQNDQIFIYQDGDTASHTITVDGCGFTMGESVTKTGPVITSCNKDNIGWTGKVIFTNNTVYLLTGSMLPGLGNGSVVKDNVFTMTKDRTSETSRTGIMSLAPAAAQVTITGNTFYGANRVLAIDDSKKITPAGLTYEENAVLNCLWAFELDSGKGQTGYDLGKNYYKYRDNDVSEARAEDGAKKTGGLTHFDEEIAAGVDSVVVSSYYAQRAYNGVLSDLRIGSKVVAEIDGVYYASLQTAIDAAVKDDTVKLLKNVEMDNSVDNRHVVVRKDMTLDLNGHTISRGTNNIGYALVATYAELTITDTSVEKTGKIDAGAQFINNDKTYTSEAVRVTSSAGKLNIEAGEYVGGYAIRSYKDTSVAVNGGKILGTNFGIMASGAAASVAVNGGEVSGGNVGIQAQLGAGVIVAAGHVHSAGSAIIGLTNAKATMGTVTVKGGLVETTYSGSTPENYGAIVANSYHVVIENGATVKGPYAVQLSTFGGNSQAETAGTSTLVMTGGNVEATTQAIGLNNLTSAGTTAEISGGTISAPGRTAIYWPAEGTLTIKGDAQISGGTGIEVKMGTVRIEGGTITGNGAFAEDEPANGGSVPEGSALLVSAQMYGGTSGQYVDSPNLTVTISGGKLISEQGNSVTVYNTRKNNVPAVVTISGETTEVTGDKAALVEKIPETSAFEDATTVEVSNGIYSSDVSAYCVEGFKAALNESTGTYGIVPKDYVAQVGEAKFETLQAAIDAAGDGQTVTLLQNVEITEGILISRKNNLTLDGGNHTIAVLDNAQVHAIQAWRSTGVNIKDVTITGAGKDALLVNQDSTVTATNLTTSGNAWGAVNVDKNSSFTLVSGNLAEGNKIWADDVASTITAPEGWTWVQVGAQRFYTTGLSISLNQTTANLYSNTTPNTVTLTVTGAPEGAAMAWASSNEAVATVNSDGLVTAVSAGAATITVTVGGMTASCAVSVTRYTSGGGGGTTGGGTTTPVTPPEEDLGENDTPLTEAPVIFEDVAETDWFHEAVSFVAGREIMRGVDESHFAPQMTTTRGMIVTILYRLEKEPEAAASAFSDVDRNTWYTAAVDWAAANGIVKGFEDGSFRPEEIITREQLAAILGRYASLKGYDKTLAGDMKYYNDKTLIGDWAVEEMTWAVGARILQGKGNSLLDPQGTATRAEAAEMLKNFCQAFVKETEEK